MHMADALISPATGAVMWTATAATTVYCAKRLRAEADAARIPLMGVAGAFVFAAQMVNFTIPGTGSSGHLGGGLLLAILLGPEAAFLVMASVLTIQALFFADGGLLALGANVFNLAVFPAFLAYPLYRRIAGATPTRLRLLAATLLAALVAVETGALGVVLETTASGIAELPFAGFVAVMLPIHLAIGLVEGLVTAGVVSFVREAQPEILGDSTQRRAPASRQVLAVMLAVAAVTAVGLSAFASVNPDGLEWSIGKVAGGEVASHPSAITRFLGELQARTSLFPDYALRKNPASPRPASSPAEGAVSGLVGGVAILLVVAAIGALLHLRSKRRHKKTPA